MLKYSRFHFEFECKQQWLKTFKKYSNFTQLLLCTAIAKYPMIWSKSK